MDLVVPNAHMQVTHTRTHPQSRSSVVDERVLSLQCDMDKPNTKCTPRGGVACEGAVRGVWTWGEEEGGIIWVMLFSHDATHCYA